VDVSLLNGALLAHAARLSVYLVTGQEPGRQGSAHPYVVPFQAFRASDGWIYVAVWVERLWPPFCAAIERPELATDGRFAGRDDRVRHRRELIALLEPIFLTRPVKEWMARLERHEVLCAPVNRYADLPTDPQVIASRMLVPEDHPRAGRLTTLSTPIRFSRTPGGIRAHAPALGEHTDEILREVGLAPDEIARLREKKVVA